MQYKNKMISTVKTMCHV